MLNSKFRCLIFLSTADFHLSDIAILTFVPLSTIPDDELERLYTLNCYKIIPA